MRSRCNI